MDQEPIEEQDLSIRTNAYIRGPDLTFYFPELGKSATRTTVGLTTLIGQPVSLANSFASVEAADGYKNNFYSPDGTVVSKTYCLC